MKMFLNFKKIEYCFFPLFFSCKRTNTKCTFERNQNLNIHNIVLVNTWIWRLRDTRGPWNNCGCMVYVSLAWITRDVSSSFPFPSHNAFHASWNVCQDLLVEDFLYWKSNWKWINIKNNYLRIISVCIVMLKVIRPSQYCNWYDAIRTTEKSNSKS